MISAVHGILAGTRPDKLIRFSANGSRVSIPSKMPSFVGIRSFWAEVDMRWSTLPPSTSGGINYGAAMGQEYLATNRSGWGIYVKGTTIGAQLRYRNVAYEVVLPDANLNNFLLHSVRLEVDFINWTVTLRRVGGASVSVPITPGVAESTAMTDVRVGANASGSFQYLGDIDNARMGITTDAVQTDTLSFSYLFNDDYTDASGQSINAVPVGAVAFAYR